MHLIKNNCSTNIDERPHRRMGWVFHEGGEFNVTPASRQHEIRCSSSADAVTDFLLRTPQQWLTMSRTTDPSTWESGPYLLHGSLGHPSLPCNRHLHRFSRFCRAHERDQPTDRQTHRPRYFVCSNSPHLAIAAMRTEDNFLYDHTFQSSHILWLQSFRAAYWPIWSLDRCVQTCKVITLH